MMNSFFHPNFGILFNFSNLKLLIYLSVPIDAFLIKALIVFCLDFTET